MNYFPELRVEAQRDDFTIYMAFFELLPRVREAHQSSDKESLRLIYGFAEWCFEQKAEQISNAAGVAFYEHLFDGPHSMWPEIVRWLSPRVVDGCVGLWESRLSERDLSEVRRLIADCRQPLHQEARRTFRDG